MKTRNEQGRHHGMNGMLPKSVPAIEVNYEMSPGHFVRMYMFRKILNSVCEWSHSYEDSGWSLMTSLKSPLRATLVSQTTFFALIIMLRNRTVAFSSQTSVFFFHETFAHGAACYAMRHENRNVTKRNGQANIILAGTDASSDHLVMKKA